MGRTGRKRNGEVIILLTKGKEAKNYHSAQDNYKRMQEYIANKSQFKMRDDISKRIIPPEITPTVDKQLITIPPENLEPAPPRGRGTKKKQPKPTKNFFMPANAKSGFTTASRLGKDDDTDDMIMTDTPLRSTFDEPLAELPPNRDDILLTLEEHDALIRSYARTFASSEEVVIGPPRLDAFPRSQRTLTTIHQVTHGRRTVKTINMLMRMRRMTEKTIAVMEKMVDERLCKSPPKTESFKSVKPIAKGLFGGLEKKPRVKPLVKTTGNTPSPTKPVRKRPVKRADEKAKKPVQKIILSDSSDGEKDAEKEPRQTSKKRLRSGGGSNGVKRRKVVVSDEDGNESDPFDAMKSSDSDLPDVTILLSGGFKSAKSLMKK